MYCIACGDRRSLFFRGILITMGLAAAPAVPSATVGYHVAGQPDVQTPVAVIRDGGHDPRLVADPGTADLTGVDVLWVLNPSNSNQGLRATPGIVRFVEDGGILLYHDRRVADANVALPGSAGIVFQRDTGETIDLLPGGEDLAAGPGGPMDDNTLDGGNDSHHGWASRASLPEDAVPVLSVGGDPQRVVDFHYPVGRGRVYYSAIPLDHYLAEPGGDAVTVAFRDVYTPNVVDLAARISVFGGPDTDGDGLPDRYEELHGLDPDDPADAGLDPDGDGLSNLEELAAGTEPHEEDTDGDGLQDGEERDGPTDPLEPDSDGDGVADGDDPFPQTRIEAYVETPGVVLAGASVRVQVSLEAQGEALPDGLRFALQAEGDAVFAEEALAGTLVAGGGTDRVTLEAAGGGAAIELTAGGGETVSLRLIDEEALGILFAGGLDLDFEANDGGFRRGGTRNVWSWGVPTRGPDRAASGTRLWGTGLTGNYRDGMDAWIESPVVRVPRAGDPVLEFLHWYRTESCCDAGFLELSAEDEPFEPIAPEGGDGWRGSSSGYERVLVDLRPWSGQEVRIRFRFRSDSSVTDFGWYVDDVRIPGEAEDLPVLTPDGDDDGDSIANAEEVERGTNPLGADTDGDGLTDAVETGTGVFAGPSDTGTDPLLHDTDGGGQPDGEEVLLGLDPLNGFDDFVTVKFPVRFVDGEGLAWQVEGDGRIERGVSGAIERFLGLRIEDDGLPGELRGRVFIGGGRQMALLRPGAVADVETERLVFVPARDGGFARWLDTFRNRQDQERTVRVRYFGEYDRQPGDVLTSNGNRVLEPADEWIALGDAAAGRELPAVAVAFAGLGGTVAPVEAVRQGDNLQWAFDLRLPPGEPVALLWFVAHARTLDRAAETIEEFAGLRGGALRGVTERQRDRVVNFGRDTDGDRIPDSDEMRLGLDPEDPSDAGLDPDEDGLTHLEEYRRGTDPRSSDTDEDGVADGDEVAAGLDPLTADTDRDGIPDGDDPVPGVALVARVESPPVAITGNPARLRVDIDGARDAGIRPRFELEALSGAAVFAGEATLGSIIERRGDARVLLETATSGTAEIDLVVGEPSAVEFRVTDSEDQGILFQGQGTEDFEAQDGGYTHGGREDPWEWGHPASGPGAAFSGDRVWATHLAGTYANRTSAWLEPPPIEVSDVGDPLLEFRHWYATESCCDTLRVEAAATGEPFTPIEGLEFRGSSAGWETAQASLAPWRGRTLRLRFWIRSDGSVVSDGWYLDDVRIAGVAPRLQVLDPEGDEDGDGLANADEVAGSTSPLRSDTDGDLLADGVETGTGVFEGPDDTGTDPAVEDTDGGSLPDGLEVILGYDPTSDGDDPVPTADSLDLTDSDGFLWDFNSFGLVNDGTGDAFDGAFGLRVAEQDFQASPQDARTGSAGRRHLFGPTRLGGLIVLRDVFVPEGGTGFARWTEVLHNPGTQPVSTRVVVSGDLGSDGSTELRATSTGDTQLGRDDDWLVTDDGPENDPTLVFVIGGPGGIRPSRVELQGDDFAWSWQIEVPPGSTAAIVHWAAQNADVPAAEAKAGQIASLAGNATQGISPTLRQAARNVVLTELAELFVRGDANADETLDLSDALRTLDHLFLDAVAPEPLDAGDANDDGVLDISDPVLVLLYLFRGGDAPPAPFPEPGIDPTVDGL